MPVLATAHLSTIPRGISCWYTLLITPLAEENETSLKSDLKTALDVYEARDAQRCVKWM